MKIGFLGFGEAAFNLALGLRGDGVTEIFAYDSMWEHPVMGELIRRRVEESAVTLEHSVQAVVQKAQVVFAAVPSSNALELSQLAVGDLREGQIYVDVSAATPLTKQTVWEQVKPTGALFVDGAMMGSLPQSKHKVPIYASGNGAQHFYDTMTPYGMKITVISEEPGAASAIKLIRSVYMKGIAALMVEMLQAADTYHVSEPVIRSIAESMDGIGFVSHLNRLVTGTAIHAARRGKELDGSAQMLAECGLNNSMTRAAKEKHDLLAAENFDVRYVSRSPKGWQEIIEAVRVKGEDQRECREPGVFEAQNAG